MIILKLLSLLVMTPMSVKATGQRYSVSRSNIPGKLYYPGQLMFGDEFDTFDLEKWKHEKTLGSLGWEFQMYLNSRDVSFVKDGILHIKPQLTSELMSEAQVYSGTINLHGAFPENSCTNEINFGCMRSGGYPLIVNPVISAHIRTVESFHFTYGRVQIRAKIAGGDWMMSQIQLNPRFNNYGQEWPQSGQVTLASARGNRKFIDPSNGANVGSNLVTGGLHFGPNYNHNGWERASFVNQLPDNRNFDEDFHLFELDWTPEQIVFRTDGVTKSIISPPSEGGLFQMAEFPQTLNNPWKTAGNKRMAPFDHKMYIAMGVSVGGVIETIFPDNYVNGHGKKPWHTSSTNAAFEFYDERDQWQPTWEGANGTLMVDYVRVYAI